MLSPEIWKKTVFGSFILPTFDFCLPIWSNSGVENTKRIDGLLRKSKRITSNRLPDAEPESMYLYFELTWLPLEYNHKFKMGSLVFNAFDHLTPSYIADLV